MILHVLASSITTSYVATLSMLDHVYCNFLAQSYSTVIALCREIFRNIQIVTHENLLASQEPALSVLLVDADNFHVE